MDPPELQETTKLSLQKARKSIHELKEKNAELEKDMETHRSLLATTEAGLRDVNMKMQSLSKTLKVRDEEAKGLVAKITILENAKAESAKDAERIRILRLALEQGKQETKAVKNDMDIAQTTIITERQAKSRAETSVRALRAEIVILNAEIKELRGRALEDSDPAGLGHEGQRSNVKAQVEEIRELRDVRDEQNATIKYQERELRKFDILKKKLCHANMDAVEDDGLERSRSSLKKKSTKVGEEPLKIYASSSLARPGPECGDLSLNLRQQLGAFGDHYNSDNSGSSASSSPAMTEASEFSSSFKIESTMESDELYTCLGKEYPSPEDLQAKDIGDERLRKIGLQGPTDDSWESNLSLGDNDYEKSKDELSLTTTSSSESEGSNVCAKGEQPDSKRPTRFGKDEDLANIFNCPKQTAGQELLSLASENEEERIKDRSLLLPLLATGVTGLGIFISDKDPSPEPSQGCCEDECLTDVAHLERSASQNTGFTHDEQIKCKVEKSSPYTIALEDEDQAEFIRRVGLSPILDAFNCGAKNKRGLLKPQGRRKEPTHAEEKYICYRDDKLSVLTRRKFKDEKYLDMCKHYQQSSLLTASKTCVTSSADQVITLKNFKRQTTSTQADVTLVSDKIPSLQPTTKTKMTISSSSPCPNPAISSFRACFYSLLRHHPFLSLLYLFFHCLFLILPFLYALTAGFAADRERRMWLSGSEVTRRATVALGQGTWEGGYWDDFGDMMRQ